MSWQVLSLSCTKNILACNFSNETTQLLNFVSVDLHIGFMFLTINNVIFLRINMLVGRHT